MTLGMGLDMDYQVELGRQRLQKLLDDITYKPNWTFQVRKNKTVWSCVELFITIMVPDVEYPDRIIPICMAESISPYHLDRMNDEVLVQSLISNVIRKAEEHEFREWFKFKGKNVFNPHP